MEGQALPSPSEPSNGRGSVWLGLQRTLWKARAEEPSTRRDYSCAQRQAGPGQEAPGLQDAAQIVTQLF